MKKYIWYVHIAIKKCLEWIKPVNIKRYICGVKTAKKKLNLIKRAMSQCNFYIGSLFFIKSEGWWRV